MKKAITLLLCLVFGMSATLQAQYQLNGSAIQTDENCFQLTPALNTQAGSMWYLEQVSLLENFTLDFDIYLGCVDVNGADGIYFVLQPISTSLGSSGGGIGFQGIVPSLGVEFDTWQNNGGSEAYDDPTFDHLAIQQNGDLDHGGPNNLAGPVAISASSDNVEDCAYHNMRITWNAETQTLSVYFDCNLRLTYTGNVVNNIFGGNPNVFWGFTSATGGANNVHAVCLDYVSFTDQLTDTTICPGESVQLNVPGGFEIYIWEPAEGLNNPNIPNPVASPGQTTTYTVTVIDECGNDFFDQATISVTEELAVDLGPDGFICENQAITLNADTPGATAYLWDDGSIEPQLTVTHSGTYWVQVSNDCYTATDTINFDPLVVDYNLDLGPDVTICQGETAQLASNIIDEVNYLWSNGAATPSIAVQQAGLYILTISNDCGVGIDSIQVSVIPDVAVNLGDANQNFCTEDVNLLNAFSDGATGYLWQDGSTAPTYLVEQTGIYSVTVSNDCGAATDVVCAVVQSCNAQCAGMNITHIVDCEPVTQNYTVYASVSGGVAPYAVSGSYNGVINEDNTVITFGPFAPGSNYILNITDAAGCVRSVLGKPSCNTLPVQLISFTGQALPQGNLLQWRVATETNCAFYTLQQVSASGSVFTPIARINAAGNTSITQQYEWLHTPAPQGKTYYRLTQTDFDGTETALGTVALQRKAGSAMPEIEAVLPVPAQNELRITFNLLEPQPVMLTLYDIAGRIALTQTIAANAGSNHTGISVANLASGMYLLHISGKNGAAVQKVVKE
ncbi:T9SS C-terminal target domain-containing protein [Sphingobacteriales bacterium UPWRP_1]|nr:hypothetical protein B6N25_16340 [Sphingobacteriales bacterium TSM_CSS]PSJ71810.1 T9SS C-terminal target domain-containing protein [Sphingobacteriales bacterium UPWRP_1]